MNICGKGNFPECEYFTTGGCVSPSNCIYKIKQDFNTMATSNTMEISRNAVSRVVAENKRLRKEIARLSQENDELKAELQKLKPNARKATDKMIEYAKIIASYTYKPLPDFNNFDETQDYIRKNRPLYLERLEIYAEANALVIDSRRDY